MAFCRRRAGGRQLPRLQRLSAGRGRPAGARQLRGLPGRQGDVSIVGDLLIMSVEQTRGRLDCGLEGVNDDVSADRFRGPAHLRHQRPDPAGAGGRGPDLPRLAHALGGLGTRAKTARSSSTTPAPARCAKRKDACEGCIDEFPATIGPRCFASTSSRFPVERPSAKRASSTARPCSPIPRPGVLAGLWKGGDHGDDTQETRADRPVPRHHRVPRARDRRRRLLGQRHPVRHLRSAESEAHRRGRRPGLSPTGTRRPSTTTAPR